MIMKNLADAGNKARARREKVKAAQNLASKAVNTVEDINTTMNNVQLNI